MKQDRLLQLRETPTDEIQSFMRHRVSATISPAMQEYILQLDTVARLLHRNRISVRNAIDQLRREWPALSIAQARGIYYDALDYFYHDEQASASAWDQAYADQLDDLKLVAIAAGKIQTAYKCIEKAHQLRTLAREHQDYTWQAPVYLVNITVKPEDLGYKTQRLADIARRNEDRKFIEMISGLETTEAEKTRLLAEAGIKTIEPEILDENDEL